MSSETRGSELILPELLPGASPAASRADVRWLVSPGGRFEKFDPLGFMRAFHTKLGCSGEFLAEVEVQVVLGAPASGTLIQNCPEVGGWYSLAPLQEWNQSRELGARAIFNGECRGLEAVEVECSVIRGERYHPFLETRNGGVVTSPFRRIDVWSGVPAPAEVKLIDLGMCDHAALFGETGATYHHWTRRFRKPAVLTRVSDTLNTYSSHTLRQELQASDADRATYADEIVSMLQEYLASSGRTKTSAVSTFLGLLLRNVEEPVLTSEFAANVIEPAHATEPKHRFVLLSLAQDGVLHLRSRETGFTFSLSGHRLAAFDDVFKAQLAARFARIPPAPETIVESYEELLPLIRSRGYEAIVSSFIMGATRVYDYGLVGDLSELPDYNDRRTNNLIRRLCLREGVGYHDANAAMSRYGSSKLIDTMHHNNEVLEVLRTELVSTMRSMGVSADTFREVQEAV